MPVKVKKVGKKYRVVDADTGGITRNKGGTAADGGGHDNKDRAEAQARAINASLHDQGKI